MYYKKTVYDETKFAVNNKINEAEKTERINEDIEMNKINTGIDSYLYIIVSFFLISV